MYEAVKVIEKQWTGTRKTRQPEYEMTIFFFHFLQIQMDNRRRNQVKLRTHGIGRFQAIKNRRFADFLVYYWR